MNRFDGSERDWTPQYSAVGQFTVEFEWICWHLRLAIHSLLQMHGLRKWELADIILNQRVFTAEPLFSCYASMAAECLGAEHALLKELEALRKRFQHLCKTRNDLLHASYLIGTDIVEISDRDVPKEIHVEKRTPDKKGARVQLVAETLDKLRAHVAEAIATKERAKSLFPCIMAEVHYTLVGQSSSDA